MDSNFKQHVLALLLLVGVATPWVATAQAPISNAGSGSIDDRVIQLERIANAQGELLTQLQQQLTDQQRDIDSLRGQLQQSQYQLEQTQKQITATPPATPEVANNASDAVAAAGSDNSVVSTGDENSDYNVAVSLAMEKKQFDAAITAFQSFIKQYPNSTYQPNANYWLGQLSYNKGSKDEAAHYFASVVKNYPKSPKSADAMFKVGLIMQDKGQNDKAKAVYQQVIKLYPKTDAEAQAKKRLAML